MWDDADPTKVVRNTRTLSAYRERNAAAQRAAAPFLLLPAFVNPALFIPATSSLLREHHLPLWIVPTILMLWLAGVCASLRYGVHRRRRYLLQHPLVGDLAGVGRPEAKLS